MKTMTQDSSASPREQAPHVTKLSRTNTIVDALKRRAQAVLNDKSIDARSRAIIRYGLETNDPWLAQLVRRADEGENVADTFDFSQTPETNESESSEKVEALAEIICRAGDESAGALLVLMGTVENSRHPKALANTVKHFALTRCADLDLYGMADAQMAVVESELLGN